MKKIRPAMMVSVAVAMTLGAVVASCLSFSSNPIGGEDASTTGQGGASVMTGSGGTSDQTGGGGTTTTGGGGGGTTTTGGGGTAAGGSGGGGGATTTTGGGGGGGATATGGSGGGGGTTTTTGGGGGATATGGSGAGGTPVVNGPCDILNAAGNTCVAAHSTVRALYKAYTGPLYQVCKGTSAPGPNSCPGGNVMNIGQVAGGYADSGAQDTFCAGGACTISMIYDQSPNANHLKPAPAGGAKATPDSPVNATDLPVMINGHKVYGVFIKQNLGYRAGCAGCGVVTPKGTATGDQAETEYMITSQNGLIDGCCFDYGNAETDSHDDGNGTMEAVYFGGGVVWGTGSPGGHTNGPWVMADLENGLYAGWENNQDQNISTNTPLKFPFVTAMLVGDVAAMNTNKGRFALYGADATAGTLKIMYDGIRPAKPGYVPMHKQGSIILGIGGDNSDGDGGQWFEGVMASGVATLTTLNSLQANIVAAKYGK